MKQHVLKGYRLLEESELGRGSFATVYKGFHEATQTPVAIKAVYRDRLNKKLAESLQLEIKIMKHFQHPNMVQLYDIQVRFMQGLRIMADHV